MHNIKYLYETYKLDVFKYLMSLTHNSTLSEDLLSETFLSAIKSVANFRGDADVKTWLFSIARYKWYAYLRKRKEEISFDDLATNYISDQLNIEVKVEQSEIADKVFILLKKESERNRKIVLMRIEGYSFYEIAKKYNISESSARVIDFRTKKKIREVLVKEDLNNE